MEQIRTNYLGIDWGARKVGLSVAHFETKLPLPFGTLINDATLLENIGRLIEQEGIGTVVIGIPESPHILSGEHPGKKLGNLLHERFGVIVEYENEMFTTKMAGQNLLERGQKGIEKNDDEEAARIILEEWLNRSKGL